MTRPLAPLLVAWLAACERREPVLQPDLLSFDVIGVDEQNSLVFRRDELYGHDWTLDLTDLGTSGPRDITPAEDGVVLVAHDRGAMRIAIDDGEVLWEAGGYVDVISAVPEPNGGAMLALQQGQDLVTVSVSRDLKANDTTYPRRLNVGVVRQTADNHLLYAWGEPWQWVEVTSLGDAVFGGGLRRPGWQIERGADGRYTISATTELKIYEIDRAGNSTFVWDATPDAETYGLQRLRGFSRLDGYLMAANALDDAPGSHAVAFDPSGAIVWSLDDDRFAQVNGVVLHAVYEP
jgi:hypothetical protein